MPFPIKLMMRNLLRQRLRTLLTLLGVMVAIIAFCLLRTLVDAWYAGVDHASANRLVMRNAVSLVFPLPISYRNRIRQVDGVTAIAYASWFGGVYQSEKNFFPQFAVDARNYPTLFPELRLDPAELLAFQRDRQGALVGRKLADTYGWKTGDVVPLRGTIYPGNWSLTVRGIFTSQRSSAQETLFLFNWDYLNETLRAQDSPDVDRVGVFYVAIADAGRAAEISSAVDQLFRNSLAETLTETERSFELGFLTMTEAILIAVKIVSFVVIVIIMAVMANTMAMTARERTREYATLLALGFRPSYVGGLIFGEALAIAIGAGLAGVAVSVPLADLIADKLGSVLPVFELAPRTMLMAIVASCAVGVVAAIFPTVRAARVSVADGLRSLG